MVAFPAAGQLQTVVLQQGLKCAIRPWSSCALALACMQSGISVPALAGGHGSIVSLRHPALSDEFEADSPDSPIARRRRPLISTWWAEFDVDICQKCCEMPQRVQD